MSLSKLLQEGIAAVDTGDEQILAEAILDLNSKVDTAIAELKQQLSDIAINPFPITVPGATVTIDVVPDEV